MAAYCSYTILVNKFINYWVQCMQQYLLEVYNNITHVFENILRIQLVNLFIYIYNPFPKRKKESSLLFFTPKSAVWCSSFLCCKQKCVSVSIVSLFRQRHSNLCVSIKNCKKKKTANIRQCSDSIVSSAPFVFGCSIPGLQKALANSIIGLTVKHF